MEENPERQIAVEQFILDQIDSVPHLEALLLLWSNRPKAWPSDELAKRLYVKPENARSILQDLVRLRLIVFEAGPPEQYFCEQKSERDDLLESVDNTYRRELIRISNMIHSKPSAAVRDFARAFRFTKERE
jgi:predicted ArsR family transcriptional regulator